MLNTASELTTNTRQRLKSVFLDINRECEREFSGEYVLKFNDGGLAQAEKRHKLDLDTSSTA